MLVGLEANSRLSPEQRNRRSVGSRGEQRLAQTLVLDDPGGGLSAVDGIVVGHEHGAEGIIEARVRDVDGRDGLGMLRDCRPEHRAR